MNKLLGITVIMILCIVCSKEKQVIEYGSNNGRQVSINGKKIYYETYGQGTPLILLSGGGLQRSIKDFEKCIPELSKYYKVIAPDSPGQGRSELADTLTYSVLLDFMSVFIDSMKLDSAYVMGWSDGGITGILLAEKRPDKVKKIIAVGANNGIRRAIPPYVPIDSVKPLPISEWAKNNKESIDEYMSKLPRDWEKLLNDLNAMWYEREAYYSDSIYQRIHIPVMIVLGDRDDIITEHGLDTHRMIKNSEFCVLPNTTHEVFSENPKLITTIAVDFFNK